MMLSIWTVYNDPLDYPGKIVARRFEVDASGSRPTESVIITDSIDKMREIMITQLHLNYMPREPGDDPKIVECWL